MEAVGNTPVSTPKFIRTLGKYVVAFAMGFWAFGESVGRARAASILSPARLSQRSKKLNVGE